jgi:ABC-2 type transport system permease protein
MGKIITVAVREFIETVKTKTFFITSVILPLILLGLIFGSQGIAKFAEQEEVPTKHLAVVDQTGAVFDTLQRLTEENNQNFPQRKLAVQPVTGPDAKIEALRKRAADGDIYAYLIIPSEALLGAPSGDKPPASTSPTTAAAANQVLCELGRKDSNPEVAERLRYLLNQAIIEVRFQQADPPIDFERVRRLQEPVGFRSIDVETGQETTGGEMIRFLTPFAFMFLLFMGTMTISQGLLTSVIEEKSSRVVEVLLSAVSPTQLMAGKILGMVCVGALLLTIWGAVGYGGAQARDMGDLVTPYRLTYVVLYFVPGFLLISAFLAAVGAACNTIKEAQSMAAPLTILSLLPIMLWWLIMLNPNGVFSIILSYIPPITPLVMILRICADPEIAIIEVIATLVLLWLSVLFTIWLAGKIFRVGVLMYGKPPSLKELLHWLRYE